MPVRPEETDLILRLYADATSGAGWDGVCARLAELTRAEAAALLVTGAKPPRLPLALAEALIHSDDPCGLRRMRPERVYAATDLPGPGALPAPWALRALAMRTGGAGMVWLLVTRQGADFRAADGALLSALAPHLPQAVDTGATLRRDRARTALHVQVAARLGGGWMAFDREGRVCAHAPQAARLLRDTARLRPGERLQPGDPDAATRFETALRRVLSGQSTTEALALGSPPAPGLVLTADAALPGTAALGWLRTPPEAAPSPETVAQFLGISLSEARLALALARGLSLRAAAGVLGLTEETARSYSRQIFARTGLRGQPDLIRALLQSPLWMTAPTDAPGAEAPGAGAQGWAGGARPRRALRRPPGPPPG